MDVEEAFKIRCRYHPRIGISLVRTCMFQSERDMIRKFLADLKIVLWVGLVISWGLSISHSDVFWCEFSRQQWRIQILKGVGSVFFFARTACFSSFCNFFLYPKQDWGGGGGGKQGPSPRSTISFPESLFPLTSDRKTRALETTISGVHHRC